VGTIPPVVDGGLVFHRVGSISRTPPDPCENLGIRERMSLLPMSSHNAGESTIHNAYYCLFEKHVVMRKRRSDLR